MNDLLNAKNGYVEKNKKYMMPIPGGFDLVMTEINGSIIKDIEGKEYIDFMSLVAGPTSIGANNPRVIKAVKDQIDKLYCAAPWAINMAKIDLAEKLSKITPGNLNKFHFLIGGGESVEYALHNAMRMTKKKEIIGLYFGYHGASFGTLNLGQCAHRRGLPSIGGFRQIPPAYCYRCFYGKEYPNCEFECAKALENMIKFGSYDDVAAFIAEPIMGNGGVITPPKGYFKLIREICDKYGVLLILDEIQTTLGRTGKLWGADYHEIVPDIMVIGKALGGGFPISASVYKDSLPEPDFEVLESVSTFAGNPIGCAAASATIDVVLEENLTSRVEKIGKIFKGRLNNLKEKFSLIGDVRGVGLFNCMEFVKDRKTKERATDEAVEFSGRCREKGLLTIIATKAYTSSIINFKPPFTIPEDLLAKGLDIIEQVLTDMKKSKKIV